MYQYQNQIIETLKTGGQKKLATQIGVSESAISQYKDGHYNGNLENLEIKIKAWIDRNKTRGNSWTNIIVHTKTMETMINSMFLVHQMKSMGIIHGPSGIGKTVSIDQYCKQEPAAIKITCTLDSRSIRGVLDLIHEALFNESFTSAGGARAVRKKVVNKLRGADVFLIFDEANKLINDAWQEVKTIHDQTGCAIMMVGTKSVYDRITEPHSGRLVEEIANRSPIKRGFEIEPPKSDLDMIAAAYDVTDDAAVNRLWFWTKKSGIRHAVNLIKLSKFMAKNQDITLDHIRKAEAVTGSEDAKSGKNQD